MKISKEEKLLINIIYGDSEITIDEIKAINIDNFIRISSSHLLIPLLYSKIKRKKLVDYFSAEFMTYIGKIHKINKNRNKELINEARELSEILNKEKIDYVFIKGTAMLLGGYFTDIGERMIGDIDFLVNVKEIKKTKKILIDNGYSPISDYNFFNFRHIPRLVNNPNKLFAIEPHIRILDSSEFFKTKDVIDNSVILENIKIPNEEFIIKTIIYNHQINDNGYNTLIYSHRNIYDLYSVVKKNKRYIFLENDIAGRYLKIVNNIGLNFLINNFELNFISKFLIYIKFNMLKLFKIYLFIFQISINLKTMIIRLREIMCNKDYRFYIYKKYMS